MFYDVRRDRLRAMMTKGIDFAKGRRDQRRLLDRSVCELVALIQRVHPPKLESVGGGGIFQITRSKARSTRGDRHTESKKLKANCGDQNQALLGNVRQDASLPGERESHGPGSQTLDQ